MGQDIVAFKVDVDTYVGTREGVPRLLGIFEKAGIQATFYFSMGPDNSGKAIRRIFTKKGFLKKILRTNAPSMYGISTLLYGTLLPPPMIAASCIEVLLNTRKAGHEVGIHCWDHVRWHDHLPLLSKQSIVMEIGRALALFEDIYGCRTRTMAAPGWTVTGDSMEVQDSLQLSYCSDSRGESPFYPVLDVRRFATLQIPTTWPTMDELIGENGITAEIINDHYLSIVKPGLNVHTIHAEIEGNVMASQFSDLIQRLIDRGVRFTTLLEAAREFGGKAGNSPIIMGEFPGRVGNVAIQG